MADYPRLPRPEPQHQDETAIGYGARLLCFVLVEGVTGTLTEDQLRAADHAYPAVLGRETSPIAVDQYSAARRMILSALRLRAAERVEASEIRSVHPKSAPTSPPHLVKVQPPTPKLPSGGVQLPYQVADLADAF